MCHNASLLWKAWELQCSFFLQNTNIPRTTFDDCSHAYPDRLTFPPWTAGAPRSHPPRSGTSPADGGQNGPCGVCRFSTPSPLCMKDRRNRRGVSPRFRLPPLSRPMRESRKAFLSVISYHKPGTHHAQRPLPRLTRGREQQTLRPSV